MVLLSRSTGRPITVQAMADEGLIPPRYLAKLLQGLSKCGLVCAQRGLKGGYVLSRPAEQISLAEIVNSVDPLKRISNCPLGIVGHPDLCPLHSKLDQTMAAIEKALTETKLSELSHKKDGTPALCSLEPPLVALGINIC